jgi:hypothetical protein
MAVKSEAANGGGLKGQTLQPSAQGEQWDMRWTCRLDLATLAPSGHFSRRLNLDRVGAFHFTPINPIHHHKDTAAKSRKSRSKPRKSPTRFPEDPLFGRALRGLRDATGRPAGVLFGGRRRSSALSSLARLCIHERSARN